MKSYTIEIRKVLKDESIKLDSLLPIKCSCSCNCSLPFSNIRNNKDNNSSNNNNNKKQKKDSSSNSSSSSNNNNNNSLEGSGCKCYCKCNNKELINKNNNSNNNSNSSSSNEIYINYIKLESCFCHCKGRDFQLKISRKDYNLDNDCIIKTINLFKDEDNSSSSGVLLDGDIEIDKDIEIILEINQDSEIIKYHLYIEEIQLSTLVNYQFYKNLIKSKPDGNYIDTIHSIWYNDYSLLETHHGYVQWLFPLYMNNGMNYYACNLKKLEAKLFRNDIDIAKRILLSYEMMLNFYGMKLNNKETGEVIRHPDSAFSNRRYRNLKSNGHNNLRVSRIITFLGHVGFQRYKQPLVQFLKNEIESKSLDISKYSLNNYWLPLIDYSNMKLYHEITLETDEELNEESIYFYYLSSHKDCLDQIHQAQF